MTYRTLAVAGLAAFALPTSEISASPLTMDFSEGTIVYWDSFEQVSIEQEYGGESYFTEGGGGGGIFTTSFAQDDILLEIDSSYEIWLNVVQYPFAAIPPFGSLTFSLLSGRSFHLDSIDLIIASTVSVWDIGCVVDNYDHGNECGSVAEESEYRLTASNGTDFLFPTSKDFQNDFLSFGNSFHSISSFTITANSTVADDPIFSLRSVTVTPVPEPGPFALIVLGIIGIWARRLYARPS